MHYYTWHMNTGEFLIGNKMYLFVIRRNVLVPGVCLCIGIGAMMHHVHTGEAVVTSDKIGHFLACHHE